MGKINKLLTMVHLSLDDNQNYISSYLCLTSNQLWKTFTILFVIFTVKYIAS